MSTDFYSETFILRDAAQDLHFDDEDALWDASSDASFHKAKESGDLFSVSGHSRRAWLGSTMQALCEMSGTAGLGFLYNSEHVPSKWRFENEYEMDACGFLFEGAQVDRVVKAINDLFQWSRDNLARLNSFESFTYYADGEGIRAAIVDAAPNEAPHRTAHYSEDGDGPWYLFAYLASIRQLMLTASKYDKAVLHIANVAWNFPVRVS